MTERRADDATRDVADWLKCEFMQDHVGDVFQAVVASVTNFGLFVRITDFGIDGLVHVTALGNDYYRFDDVKQMLIGEASGRVFRLGDCLEVKVAGVNLDDRKIDLVLANSEPDMPKSKRKKTTKTRKGPSKPGTDAPKACPPRAKKGKSSSRDKKKKKQSKHRK
jgi:ribonuclease R